MKSLIRQAASHLFVITTSLAALLLKLTPAELAQIKCLVTLAQLLEGKE